MTQMSFNILISFYSTCWISRWSRSPSLTILYRVNWTICTAYMWTVKVISGFSIEDNSIATLLSSILNLLVIPLAIYLHTTLNAISPPTKSRCNNFHKLPCKAAPQPEFHFSGSKNMTYFQADKQTNEAYENRGPSLCPRLVRQRPAAPLHPHYSHQYDRCLQNICDNTWVLDRHL